VEFLAIGVVLTIGAQVGPAEVPLA